MPSQKQALGGVRVLEISQYFAGPLLGRMMADMGAEVVKLELASNVCSICTTCCSSHICAPTARST